MPNQLFYIHGFNSSPKSAKACLIADYLQQQGLSVRYQVPELSYSPSVAISTLEANIVACLAENKSAKIGLIGSSMGGYYGTWIAEKYGLSLVLVNPAVRPYKLLPEYLGENENIYTGEKYQVTEAAIDELKQLEVDPITRPERYLLLTQQGDEVLDYREGVEKYQQSRQIVQPGGSHGFDGFELMLPEIMAFLFE
ncbi:MAG: esterase [Moraxellaceae bacterium]|nr:MAG: esterase [Moraxellaceae bacterium]